FHVGGDPFAVAKSQDRFTGGTLVSRVRLEAGVVQRPQDDIFDVARGNPASAIGIRGREDRKTFGGEDACVRLPIFEAAVEPVHRHLDSRAVPGIGPLLQRGRAGRRVGRRELFAAGGLRGLPVTPRRSPSSDKQSHATIAPACRHPTPLSRTHGAYSVRTMEVWWPAA